MVDRYDVLAFIGLIVLGVGLWMVLPQLALIVVGSIILILAVLGSSSRAKYRALIQDRSKRREG